MTEDDSITHSSRHKRWLLQALKASYKSDFDCYKHGAVLVKGGSVLKKGKNHSKRGRLFNKAYEERSFHAEADILAKVSLQETKHAVLYVAGRNRTGLVNSKPCSCCQKVLNKYNLKAVFYLTDNGEVAQLKMAK